MSEDLLHDTTGLVLRLTVTDVPKTRVQNVHRAGFSNKIPCLAGSVPAALVHGAFLEECSDTDAHAVVQELRRVLMCGAVLRVVGKATQLTRPLWDIEMLLQEAGFVNAPEHYGPMLHFFEGLGATEEEAHCIQVTAPSCMFENDGGEQPIAVCIPTYCRADCSSVCKLRRALGSVAAQQNAPPWHVFIVGDAYERHEELLWVVQKCLPKGSFTVCNYHIPGERGRVPPDQTLWYVAGATALNCGLNQAFAHGYKWAAHLDDDDEWAPDHLWHLAAGIARHPTASLVHTQSQYNYCARFPALCKSDITKGHVSLSSNVIHSSTAINLAKIGSLRYPCRCPMAGDAYMWEAIQAAHGLDSIVHIPAVTVWHLSEAGSSEITKLQRLLFQDLSLWDDPVDCVIKSAVFIRLGGQVPLEATASTCLWDAWKNVLVAGGVIQFRASAIPFVLAVSGEVCIQNSATAEEYQLRCPGYVHVYCA